jgi:hypothetical protein
LSCCASDVEIDHQARNVIAPRLFPAGIGCKRGGIGADLIGDIFQHRLESDGVSNMHDDGSTSIVETDTLLADRFACFGVAAILVRPDQLYRCGLPQPC